jgi:hypothetical protein
VKFREKEMKTITSLAVFTHRGRVTGRSELGDGPIPTSGLPTTRSESVERDAQRREFDSLYAAASNGWSFAPLIKSHKIIAGSPSVSGMFAIRPTRFA